MFTVFGYAGQTVYNRLDARHTEQVVGAVKEAALTPEGGEKIGFWNKVAEMKWSPMKALSDEEYASILKERLLSLEARIALVDEEMEILKSEGQVNGTDDRNNVQTEKVRK